MISANSGRAIAIGVSLVLALLGSSSSVRAQGTMVFGSADQTAADGNSGAAMGTFGSPMDGVRGNFGGSMDAGNFGGSMDGAMGSFGGSMDAGNFGGNFGGAMDGAFGMNANFPQPPFGGMPGMAAVSGYGGIGGAIAMNQPVAMDGASVGGGDMGGSAIPADLVL